MAAPDYPYVALSPILLDGVLAFAEGDLVPAEHVDGGIVDPSLVAKRDVPAGAQRDAGEARPAGVVGDAENQPSEVTLPDAASS